MKVVLDASAGAEISAKTQRGIDFINILMNADPVIAPDLYIAEISNVMWKLSRRDKANTEIYYNKACDCVDCVDEFVSSGELWKDALRIGQEYDHPVYDMLYAALAKREGAALLTMDAALQKICSKLSISTIGFNV